MPYRRSYRKKIKIIAVVLAVVAGISAFLLGVYFFLIPRKYLQEVRSAAAAYTLEEELVLAIIRAESNFDTYAVSRAGACGLMQIMPSTAFFIAGGKEEQDLFDPEENVMLGCKYLRYLFDRFGDTEVVLAAYNAGEGNVRLWLAENDGASLIGSIPYGETRAYVKRVKKFYNYYKFFYF